MHFRTRCFATQGNFRTALFLALFVSSSALLTGCLTPKKMDQWIGQKYGSTAATFKPKATNGVSFYPHDTVKNQPVAHSERLKTKIIPAFFYWQWNYTISSELRQSVAMTQVRSGMMAQINSAALRKQLNGHTLELNVTGVPHSFLLRNRGHLIYALLFYVKWERTWIKPGNEDLVIEYRLKNGETEVKSGTVRVAAIDPDMSLKMFQSVKKLTWQYLDQYDANAKVIGRMAMNQIISELQTIPVAAQ